MYRSLEGFMATLMQEAAPEAELDAQGFRLQNYLDPKSMQHVGRLGSFQRFWAMVLHLFWGIHRGSACFVIWRATGCARRCCIFLSIVLTALRNLYSQLYVSFQKSGALIGSDYHRKAPHIYGHSRIAW